jgi:hypothetical protein
MFWGEYWTGVLGGLLIKKPLCYDPTGVESLYREFETSAELDRAASVLDDIIQLDRLLGEVAPELDPTVERTGVTFKSLLLTLWAEDWLGLQRASNGAAMAGPLPMDALREFLRVLMPMPADGNAPRRIPEDMKTAFKDWLASTAGWDREALAAAVGAALGMLFLELEDEYAQVAPRDLDPRYIRLFIV